MGWQAMATYDRLCHRLRPSGRHLFDLTTEAQVVRYGCATASRANVTSRRWARLPWPYIDESAPTPSSHRRSAAADTFQSRLLVMFYFWFVMVHKICEQIASWRGCHCQRQTCHA
ncbi:unnamed protein product [Amoebophrya sp. A120]|nr:unnamed protein product [Amoebophrya sp. A120]|eukprot:GSA120T00021029001.1